MHVELWGSVGRERAPVFLAGGLAVITNGVSLVGLIERLEPEEVNAPVEQAADSGLPVRLHVVVACDGGTCIGATGAGPAGFLIRMSEKLSY